MLDSTRIAHLQQSLRGELIYKGSPGYDTRTRTLQRHDRQAAAL